MTRVIRKSLVFVKRDALERLSYKTEFVFTILTTAAQLVPFFFITRLIGTGAGDYLKEYRGDYFPFVN